MAELSYFWDGNSVGDAVLSPYDAATKFSAALAAVAGTIGAPNSGGVIRGGDNQLVVTGASSPLAVASGRALVVGTYYTNDSAISVAIPTPGGATRIDRLAIRKDWATKTARLIRIAGVEGGGAPALVQTIGAQWDIPLYLVSTTTGGAITLTDQRQMLPYIDTTVLVDLTTVQNLQNKTLVAPIISNPLVLSTFDSASSVGLSGKRPMNFVPISPPGAATAISGTGSVGPLLTGALASLPASAIRVKLFVTWAPGNVPGSALAFLDTVGAAVQSFDLVKDASTVFQVHNSGEVNVSGTRQVYYQTVNMSGAWTGNIYVIGYYEYM